MVIVAAGAEKYVGLTLDARNRVEGSVSVEGGGGNDVNFYFTDPFGNNVLEAGRVSGNRSFAFIAASSGEYRLYFDNSFSIFSNKVVNYTATIHQE